MKLKYDHVKFMLVNQNDNVYVCTDRIADSMIGYVMLNKKVNRIVYTHAGNSLHTKEILQEIIQFIDQLERKHDV